MATIKFTSREEHTDLVIWAQDHADQCTTRWLESLQVTGSVATFDIPADIESDLDNLLEDWSEVLEANDEPLNTTITV
jgi:hypothetical protein